MDIQDWFEVKFGFYGYCLDYYYDDIVLLSNNIFFEIYQIENGRLFRLRLDEILLQLDNYSGKGFRKKVFYEFC